MDVHIEQRHTGIPPFIPARWKVTVSVFFTTQEAKLIKHYKLYDREVGKHHTIADFWGQDLVLTYDTPSEAAHRVKKMEKALEELKAYLNEQIAVTSKTTSFRFE